jgi:hypothetical protein
MAAQISRSLPTVAHARLETLHYKTHIRSNQTKGFQHFFERTNEDGVCLRLALMQHPLRLWESRLPRLRFPLITLWNSDLPLPRPVHNTFPITTLMHRAEIW